jgi:inorganic pyrophosphatase
MNYIKDVALYNEDGTVNGVIEICPNTSRKMELNIPGCNRLVCVREVEGLYPFYYGSFPRTHAGDNDPLDMILFTDKVHQSLDLVKVDIIGAVKTIDAGEQDDKIICVESDCDLLNVKK